MKKITFLLGIAFLQLALFGQIPTDSLKLYFPFNSNAIDESGNGNDGIINGASLTEDRFGNPNSAFYFDGVNDWIEVAHAESINFNVNNNYSISVWVKMNPNHITGDVLGKWENSYDPCPYRFQIENQIAPGAYSFARYIGGTPQDSTRQQIARYYTDIDTDFHFLTAIYRPNSIDFYFDGLLVDTSNNYMLLNNVANSYNLFIGKREGINDRYFNGIIDDIRIFSKALNQEEVTALYNDNVGIQHISNNNIFDVFPNPASNNLFITLNDNSIRYKIRVINSLNQEVYYSEINNKHFILDLNTWTNKGIHFIQFYDADGNFISVKKVIIK